MKWRRTFLALLAALALGAATAPEASARGGWRGRGWRGRGLGWAAPAIGLGLGLGLAGAYNPYYPYYGPYPYRGRGCWRRAVVETPWGPRVRRVWVC
jgi:hypothetical protein